ncbi:MAG: hypothetical protein FWD71_13675 [Oscillospiraceae bacterium]|nr:hypothetical protein [Oscillospiraceae bacterium]
MNTKLIMVEGLPGAGKTTDAIKIYEYLKSKNINAVLYEEGELHPVDLKLNACVSKEIYDEILIKYSDIANEIIKNTAWNGNQAVIAFSRISCNNKEFYSEMDSYEIYNGRVDIDKFCSLLKDRWANFAKEAAKKEEINIFESSFMQSQVNDLLGIYNCDKQITFNYLEDILESVKGLNPIILYLSLNDIEKTVKRIADERISNDAWANWIDMAIGWIEWIPYGKAHNLKGFEGVVEYCRARKELEEEFLIKRAKNYKIINVSNDYDKIWKEIKIILDNLN